DGGAHAAGEHGARVLRFPGVETHAAHQTLRVAHGPGDFTEQSDILEPPILDARLSLIRRQQWIIRGANRVHVPLSVHADCRAYALIAAELEPEAPAGRLAIRVVDRWSLSCRRHATAQGVAHYM